MTINPETENRNMHFIIDCDDVLLDWIGSFKSWLFANYQRQPTSPAPDSWSLADWLGMGQGQCASLIAEFNASQSFGRLRPVPGAPEAIARLKNNGHKLTVLTSCSSDPQITLRRRENLQREFDSAFDRVICLDLGEKKASWLEVLRTGVWIEDNYNNAMDGMKAGHKTFMMRRSHNRDDERSSNSNIVWVDDWRPVISLFS